ncbi:hypothetical protein D1841_14055 [Neglecta sp. X4]|jgi:cell division protein FtsI/penicillin-binding protein 2|uniref:hypothetical protein n=1 Tax=Eubacteriales TaxID=186802 RepID=UPI00136F96D5|nr:MULTISPECIES: hypothetical protein [Eubacteriales]NBI18679.1 hypothetical protein [Neglectibacter sp. 59]NBJ74357.1 hypothetical protein [Neglectibacter sp. X4]NCE82121.1 hypothetical protein [Neglectibacter sp. X58]
MGETYLEKMDIKVMKKTADNLRKVAGELELSVGEVVDRFTEKMAPDDPQTAVWLIAENVISTTAMLSEEDHAEVVKETIRNLLLLFPSETMDKLVAEAKENQKDAISKLLSMPEDQRAELAETIKELERFADSNQ